MDHDGADGNERLPVAPTAYRRLRRTKPLAIVMLCSVAVFGVSVIADAEGPVEGTSAATVVSGLVSVIGLVVSQVMSIQFQFAVGAEARYGYSTTLAGGVGVETRHPVTGAILREAGAPRLRVRDFRRLVEADVPPDPGR
ncbi:hypothetical protein ARHIZOSPH14_07530 [Agromyces rhizosphaerae]|uniref:Uncharacterized protein n=1 Tax=Agromyces rhizosphaerae TaxID=88374 RepID=A0A9W6CUW9_9MICO|nr:hypothetical protein [Agromyces rhizosphaerae]GLI26511.1 hypothetical protein ARHIZOSPH14_07530 [Agromyces rhizosphaerae]